jgi:hypothetical protein
MEYIISVNLASIWHSICLAKILAYFTISFPPPTAYFPGPAMPTESTAAKTDCKLTIVLGSAWPGTQAAQTRRHEEGWKTERPSGYKSREPHSAW